MPTSDELQSLYDKMAKLREQAVETLGSQLIADPKLAEEVTRQADQAEEDMLKAVAAEAVPSDGGLAQLIGLGADATPTLGGAQQPEGVDEYDDTVTSERILGVADLYYVYSLDALGVFTAILKLQELFKAGTIRISSGPGAYGLYRYDRRRVLRYTMRDRLQGYRRVFGYTNTQPAPGAQPNHSFHSLFVHFIREVVTFWRDKRVSEVIRPRADDPSYGSIAIVRRAGLDLRNNLKHASYGHVVVLRIELLQLLDEAFKVLGSDDIKKLFGADNAWDVIEEVMRRYLGRPQINASQRNRMAIAGRDVLGWLAQPFILNTTRAEFETLLMDIGDRAEEWLTSAEALGITARLAPTSRPPQAWDRRPLRQAPAPRSLDRRYRTGRRQPSVTSNGVRPGY
jgi:hypothetical protein